MWAGASIPRQDQDPVQLSSTRFTGRGQECLTTPSANPHSNSWVCTTNRLYIGQPSNALLKGSYLCHQAVRHMKSLTHILLNFGPLRTC